MKKTTVSLQVSKEFKQLLRKTAFESGKTMTALLVEAFLRSLEINEKTN
jgi:hypothetical protein